MTWPVFGFHSIWSIEAQLADQVGRAEVGSQQQ
jgi:hypothetical protein